MILTAPSFLSPSSAILARHRSVPTAVVGTESDQIRSEHHDYRWVQHVFHSIALLYPPPAHTLPHRISSFQPTHADKWRRRSFYCNGNCEKGGLRDVDTCVALEHPRRILCMFSMSCLLSLYILFSSLIFYTLHQQMTKAVLHQQMTKAVELPTCDVVINCKAKYCRWDISAPLRAAWGRWVVFFIEPINIVSIYPFLAQPLL